MRICAGCGLPAPWSSTVCALCRLAFPALRPAPYRVTGDGATYRWTTGGEEVAQAVRWDDCWSVRQRATGQLALTLIRASTAHRTRVAMVDDRARLVAVLTSPAPGNADHVALVHDGHEQLLLVVRRSGPTGVHVIDPEGNVLAVASGLPGEASGLDLLLTEAGAALGHVLLFGVGLSLELLHVRELRVVAS